ncbi:MULTISPECIES: putative ABC transporter permease [Clostridium]|uniref:ABC transporter permease n=1 Tax=Clostridium cibarium TaxID=2762247 RepID=A0ABR8PUC9_9CLOT|nr:MULTISPECIES: putative ABC transporter permease [Clostridium]MBD7911725.1 putative ABC transporter permease [Clostridium cibarium]
MTIINTVNKKNGEYIQAKSLNLSEVSRYYLYFMFYSFLGWAWEKVFIFIIDGTLEERGFLHIPVCTIYGVGVALILFLFSKRNYNMMTVFGGSVLVTGLLEFITSWEMEKLFRRIWWDYSGWIFNIYGRVSLFSSIGFGVFGIMLVYWIHPFLYKVLDKYFRMRFSLIISGVLGAITVIDFIYTIYSILII